MLNVRTSVSAGDTAWCMSAFSVWQLSQHSLTPFTFTPHPILLLPIWRIGWAEYRWRWLVLPVCCPFNSRALIFPKCALPWENGRTFPTMGITNYFFFLQKKLVIQGKHIAMHYSNPRPKFEDWLCNKVRLGSAHRTEPQGLAVSVCVSVWRRKQKDTVASFCQGVSCALWLSLGPPVSILEDRIPSTLDILFIKIQVLSPVF